MIPEKYVTAYKNFVEEEISLNAKYNGEVYAAKLAPYYQKMIAHIEANVEEYVIFDKSSVKFWELEFAEYVVPIREKLLKLAVDQHIPMQTLFIPRVKIEGDKWDRVIFKGVVKLVRQVYDESDEDDFSILRRYLPTSRSSKLYFWTENIAGKKAIAAISNQTGLKSKELVVKQLKLFNNDFVKQQMQWMSREIWIHKELSAAYDAFLQHKQKPQAADE
jgi:hypothetical protein